MERLGENKLLKKIVSATVLVLLVIIIITLPCNIQPVKADSSNVIATYGEGYLENVNGALVLHVKGSPYEMGYQHGFLLKDWVPVVIQARIQKMIQLGYSKAYMVNCSQAMESHIPPEYIQEMQGLADGASINYTDVLLAQIADDIEYYGPGWTECSGFVVFGNATMDGHLYHGRSLDSYVPSGESAGLITVYEPESGNAFVNVGFIGLIGVYTGMNEEGITLELNISTSSNKTLDGMPIMFIARKVLQYSNNLTEATDIICQADRTTGWNVLLGDGKNLNACAVEISDNYCKVFWAGDPAENITPHYPIQDAVRRTNHYVDPELAATQRSPYNPATVAWNWSWNRYEKLSDLIEDNYGNITAEMSIGFLRTPPVAWAAINCQSMVFDSTDLELWVANAANNTPAYEQEFIYLSYDDLFPEVDLTITSTAGGSVTPGVGTHTYDEGTVVNLTATPDGGYRFGNWTGDVDTIAGVTAATTNITMWGNYSITANFVAVYNLTITSTAGGTVTTPGVGTYTRDAGTVVNLTATPDGGYRFDNWTGPVANVTAATTTITMNGDYSIMAHFAKEPTVSGGCFIATAAYGTPMAEEVQILREFRDEYLLTNPVGRAFVDFYYKVSPPMAEFITEHPRLKPIVRAGLMPAVAMSIVVVNTTPAEKIVIIGLLALVSVALTIWAKRRRGGGPQYT